MSTDTRFEIPVLASSLADTHSHLDMLEDPAGALARAALVGVDVVVTVVDPTEEPERTFGEIGSWLDSAAELISELHAEHAEGDPTSGESTGRRDLPPKPPLARIIVGVHPHNAKAYNANVVALLIELASRPIVAGIGEIGLDYHYDYSPRDVQRRVFEEQLVLASGLGLPVSVHLREAHDDGLAIMRNVGLPISGCVLHCFTGDRELLAPFVELGCYVSFAGPVTFKKADDIREACTHVPMDRLLVETDAPFMTPEPYRGRKNEPALTVFTAQRIAEMRGVPADELAAATSVNARRLFCRMSEREGEG